MAELKCTNCGGAMLADEENEYAVCEYCGAKQKIEKSEAEIKAELLRKKAEEKAKNKETTKKGMKKFLLIFFGIFIIPFVLLLATAFVMGIVDAFKEDNEAIPNTTIVAEEQIEETSAQNQETNSYYFEPIEIADLFYGGLEKAEEVLEPQSKAPQDIEAYTRYTFNNVAVMCEYGTNSIYSITVDFTNKNTNVDYTVFGLTKNTTRMNWDNALGEMFYQGYDSDGNPVYSYELEYNENTTYSVEITATSDTPDKIAVYKQYS